MHWFEQLTGLSPDGGSGTLEALIDASFVAVLAGVWWLVRCLRGRS